MRRSDIRETQAAGISGRKSTSTCLVAQSIEALEDLIESSDLEGARVFDEREVGPHLFEDPSVLEPEAGLLTFESGSKASVADVGAGETSADEVDPLRRRRGDGADVVESDGVGPVVGEDFPAERRDLGLVLDLSSGGELDGEFEEADAGEERSDFERVIHFDSSRLMRTQR